MSLLVNFPWYDLPELNQMHNQLWFELKARLERRGLSSLPDQRHAEMDHDLMLLSDQLFLTQTCGFDVANQVPRRLSLVGSPVFDLCECPKGHYFSYILSHKQKPDGALALSINDSRSWSGCHALLKFCEDRTLEIDWPSSQFSGSHRKSLTKLLNKESDLAAIDAITLQLYTRYAPQLFDQLFVVGRTDSIPAPPYVTSPTSSENVKNMIFQEFQALITSSPWIQESLLLLDLEQISVESYELCKIDSNLKFLPGEGWPSRSEYD